jgi:hypothetical protein
MRVTRFRKSILRISTGGMHRYVFGM